MDVGDKIFVSVVLLLATAGAWTVGRWLIAGCDWLQKRITGRVTRP